MSGRKPLEWYGDEDNRLGYPDCPACLNYMNKPGLVGACASVGIEHGKSTGLMLREIVDAYHARRHEENTG